jgi:hypothetical protein
LGLFWWWGGFGWDGVMKGFVLMCGGCMGKGFGCMNWGRLGVLGGYGVLKVGGGW